MQMQLICGQCRRWFSVPKQAPHARRVCPHCGHTFEALEPEPHGEHDRLMLQVRDDIWPEQEDGFAVSARQSLGKKIEVKCEHCGREFAAGARYSGKTAICPSCSKGVPIPYLHQEHEDIALASMLRDESELQRLDLVSALQSAAASTGAAPAAPQAAPVAVAERGHRTIYLWVGAGAAAVVLDLMLSVLLLPENGEGPDGKIQGTQNGGSAAANGGSHTPPISTPTHDNNVADTGPATVPENPVCGLVDVQTSVFAAGGYLPAPPRHVYWKTTVRLRAGSEPLEFDSWGDDVVLLAGNDKFASLGLEGEDLKLPSKGQKTTIKIETAESRRLTFVFETPQIMRTGRLKIKGLDDVKIELSGAPVAPASGEVVGVYAESPPRSLRPLLSGSVMSAIQNTGRHRLIITPRASGGGMDISIPEAQVGGRIVAVDRHLYKAVLTYGRDRLECLLRMVGPHEMVLYLSTRPFHQLTYQKTGAAPPEVRHEKTAPATSPRRSHTKSQRSESAPDSSSGRARPPGFFGM